MSKTDIATIPLKIKQGDCLTKILTFYESDGTTAKNVSAWTFECDIKSLYDAATVLASCSFSQAGLSTNQIKWSLTAVQTAALEAPDSSSDNPGRFNQSTLIYDLKATVDDGCTYTIQQGPVYVTPKVT